MRIRCRVTIALLLLSLLLPGRAICEEKTLKKPLEKPLWELGIGLGLLQYLIIGALTKTDCICCHILMSFIAAIF